ncbi:MAG TPA: ABC transporter substrate-binding protein, partial [Telluria sp.]|nr:ABC transporter substrate-binding protein [Telluria sp.]
MRLRFACLCALACGPAAAGPAEIVFLAPQNHAMPIARFEHGRLAGGILKDLGDAIAARLGVPARFVSVPSKRVALALRAGEADGVCYVLPGWIDGDYRWTQPIIPNGVAVVAHGGAPVVHSLSDLAGHRVGTVLGYRYPLLEQV